MPHLRLEYSTNIKEKISKELFFACHQILVATIQADLNRCQSRAIPCDHFYVGDGNFQQSFIYLEILVLEGRSSHQLQEMGRELLKVLENYFSTSLKELKLQIAVRVIEFSPSNYFKISYEN